MQKVRFGLRGTTCRSSGSSINIRLDSSSTHRSWLVLFLRQHIKCLRMVDHSRSSAGTGLVSFVTIIAIASFSDCCQATDQTKGVLNGARGQFERWHRCAYSGQIRLCANVPREQKNRNSVFFFKEGGGRDIPKTVFQRVIKCVLVSITRTLAVFLYVYIWLVCCLC